MMLILLLVIGSLGAAASAFGLARGGQAARAGAFIGGLALLAVVAIALALNAPRVGTGAIPEGVGLLDGRLVPNDYLRLVMALWAMDAALLVGIAWLGAGLKGLRGLLPALLVSIVGGTVALAATELTLGAAAAGATGLVALVVLLATSDQKTIAPAAREMRSSLVAASLLIAAIALAPIGAALAIRSAGAAEDLSGGAGAIPATEATALVGLLVLTISVAVAIRFGIIPFHLRIPRLVDAAPPMSLPLLLAWVPLPVAVVGLATVDRLLAPLALPLAGEQWLIIAVAVVTLLATSLAAFVQDDLGHTVGYLVIADSALVLLAFAALDPEAWGPGRTWLLALAASKTAVAAWAAVAEGRYGTRSIPDMRGWLRRSPLLGAALVIAAVATYGFPGWAAFEARVGLARLTAGAPLDAILLVAGFLTLPTYLRLLAVGTGQTTSRVERAAPERIVRMRRTETLPVELEGGAPGSDAEREAGRQGVQEPVARRVVRRSGSIATTGATSAGRRFATALRRDATELTAAAVLALAILAALTSWGVLDISGAASEPAPIVSGPSSD